MTLHLGGLLRVRESVPPMNLTDVEAVLDTLATPVVVWDLGGHNLASNSAAAALFGYSPEGMRALNRSNIVHPEDLESVQARVQERAAGDRTRRHFARRVVTAQGEVRLCACSAAPYERDGEIVGTVVEYFDAARLEQVGGAFARNAAMFRELFELSPVAVFSTGPDHRFDMVNPTARLLLQRPIEELHELTLAGIVVDDYQSLIDVTASGDDSPDNVELEIARPDGSRRWVHLSLRTLSDGRGRFAGQVGLAQDITQQVMDRQAAVSAAHHDALTGALNRRAFDARVAPDAAQNTALAVIDLNDFKSINDHYGHGVGDEALLTVATALGNVDGVEVYRTGGDEFVAIAAGWTAARLERALPRIVPIPGRAIRASLAVGAAVAPTGTPLTVAAEAADQRMYRAKRARQAALRRSA